MFSRILKVGVLVGCLVAAGTASAADRNVVVPVLAGAAAGAVLVAVLANTSDNDDKHQPHQHYHQPPKHRNHYHRQAPRAVKHRNNGVEYVLVPVERRVWQRGHR